MERSFKILTNFIYPPIPVRDFDWCAWDDTLGEDSLVGWGSTKQSALDNLREQLEDT